MDAFICMQEVLWHQLVDLVSALNASRTSDSKRPSGKAQVEWDFVGVGRDDGYRAGEFNPIFYKPNVWQLLEHRTEWLSPRPHQKGWDAACNRIVEIARFQKRETNHIVVIMNTHLDHQGVIARRQSARMINSLAHQTTEIYDERVPLVLTADMNSNEQGEAYQIINGPIFQDSRGQVEKQTRYGEEMTFTGFRGNQKDKEKIDYIFTGPCLEQGNRWNVGMYAVLPNRFDDGVYLSDHRAVVADLELK